MSDDWKTKTYREGERFPGRIGRTFEDSEPALGREGLFAEREQDDHLRGRRADSAIRGAADAQSLLGA